MSLKKLRNELKKMVNLSENDFEKVNKEEEEFNKKINNDLVKIYGILPEEEEKGPERVSSKPKGYLSPELKNLYEKLETEIKNTFLQPSYSVERCGKEEYALHHRVWKFEKQGQTVYIRTWLRKGKSGESFAISHKKPEQKKFSNYKKHVVIEAYNPNKTHIDSDVKLIVEEVKKHLITNVKWG